MKAMKKLWLLSLSPVLVLSGCAPHLTQQQCQSMNWYQTGLNDGINGRKQDLSRPINDCAQFHIQVDANAYWKGFNQGIIQYCTYNQGLNLGTQGAPNPNICPAPYDKRFNQGYRQGTNQFCSDPNRGYLLGSQGSGYPAACDAMRFPGFNLAYSRGQAIYNRSNDLQGQIDNINDEINHLADKYHYKQRSDGTYRIGHRDSDAAEAHLDEINQLVAQRNHLQNKLYKAQTR